MPTTLYEQNKQQNDVYMKGSPSYDKNVVPIKKRNYRGPRQPSIEPSLGNVSPCTCDVFPAR